ncbi:hypothetical protein [Leptolyngbya sp. FACHB-261]|uniref:hypothetical protein n=1 Tax=Leptolyngbya sp. FACHB-261 TaxID=2692806 RepID=UPI001686F6BD|nr:hypothetical protein [Leptolyngbya sp. FACHB-261]MBD2100029.1 hypothetical protein [Leptolyngbya sp. FACHB-261]
MTNGQREPIDQRLDRLSIAVAQLVEIATAHQHAIEANTRNVEANTQAVRTLAARLSETIEGLREVRVGTQNLLEITRNQQAQISELREDL